METLQAVYDFKGFTVQPTGNSIQTKSILIFMFHLHVDTLGSCQSGGPFGELGLRLESSPPEQCLKKN